MQKLSDWELAAHPVSDATLDGRPKEGTTNLEHSVLVESLASRLTEGMLSLEPLEQSVFNTLLVARPTEGSTETTPPERLALASQLDYGHLNLESLARPMLDVALDRRSMEGLAVPLPVESLGLAMAPTSEPMEALSVSRPLEHSVLDIKMGIDKLDIHDGPLFASDRGWSRLVITDAMRREALPIRSTGRISDDSVRSLILSPEQDSLCVKEMSLAEVSSEGLRQWNMDIDVEYQYETFDGLPVYYGGDMYDMYAQLVPSGVSTMCTEETMAGDTPRQECSHDDAGLRPRMNIESPYGGGQSYLPGAIRSLLPVKFPAAPVLLADGPQSGSGRVAVVRVDETGEGMRGVCGGL